MPRLTSAGPWTRLAVGTAALALALIVVLNSSLPARPQPVQAADDLLRYLGGEPKTLDPAFISDAADVQLLLQLYRVTGDDCSVLLVAVPDMPAFEGLLDRLASYGLPTSSLVLDDVVPWRPVEQP